jgi:hypothetical protein
MQREIDPRSLVYAIEHFFRDERTLVVVGTDVDVEKLSTPQDCPPTWCVRFFNPLDDVIGRFVRQFSMNILSIS